MNKFIGIGRVATEPDIRSLNREDGTTMLIAKYNLAIDRYGTHASNEQSADFIRCVAFGKNAEFTEKYLHVGTKIGIEAHVQSGSYTDESGRRIFTTDFCIERQEFAGAKNTSDNADAASPNTPDNDNPDDLPFD